MAGKRKGKDDERHLWPEMRRAIREIQPRWIVGENVLGLVNWSGGLVFEEVQADLEAEGYEVWAYVLPAAAVNAPHRRDRVWFVAHATGNGYDAKPTTTNNIIGQDNIESGTQWKRTAKGFGNERAAADTDNCFNKTLGQRSVLEEQKGQGQTRRLSNGSSQPGWLQFPTQSPVCTGDDGLPPRLDGITFPKWRNESIKAAGNAIVPQVVLQIFKSIEQYDTTTKKATN
jgi:DNA (cytosine-5)-methyltransferase 1